MWPKKLAWRDNNLIQKWNFPPVYFETRDNFEKGQKSIKVNKNALLTIVSSTNWRWDKWTASFPTLKPSIAPFSTPVETSQLRTYTARRKRKDDKGSPCHKNLASRFPIDKDRNVYWSNTIPHRSPPFDPKALTKLVSTHRLKWIIYNYWSLKIWFKKSTKNNQAQT